MVEQLFCNLDDKSIVYRSVSDLFGVCTYYVIDNEKVLIVDPGRLSEDVYIWLQQFKNQTKIIYLTHEHFDHHYDVNKLLTFENTFTYEVSEELNKALLSSRTNLSYYYNVPIETNCFKTTNRSFFEIIKTPGHSILSVCFLYKNMLFGGDTVIDKKNLVLKLPGSNKLDYKKSVSKLKEKITKDTIVLPGHGEQFCFDLFKI